MESGFAWVGAGLDNLLYNDPLYLAYYRVFQAFWTQELGYCELIYQSFKMPSIGPQDQAQITFREEMNLNIFRNESGR